MGGGSGDAAITIPKVARNNMLDTRFSVLEDITKNHIQQTSPRNVARNLGQKSM